MLAMAAFAVGGLLLTLSRQGVIGMFLAVLVLLAWPPFRRWLFALLGIVVLVTALNFGTLTSQRDAAVVGSRLSIVGERLQTLTEGQQIKQDQRVKIWSAAPAMIADRPFFGVGAANYSVWSPRYNVMEAPGVAFDHAHDVFLTIAIEEGIVGLAVFLLFLAAVVVSGARALRSGGPDKPLALAIVAALVAELGHGDRRLPAAHQRDHGHDHGARRSAGRLRPARRRRSRLGRDGDGRGAGAERPRIELGHAVGQAVDRVELGVAAAGVRSSLE